MRQFIVAFIQAQNGNILIIFGLAVFFLIGIGGAGIDLGAKELVRANTQQASDAAATSAASMENIGTTQRSDVAQRYFKLNFPSTLFGVERPTPNVNVTDNKIHIDASVNVPTFFVRMFGVLFLNDAVVTEVDAKADSSDPADIFLFVNTWQTGQASEINNRLLKNGGEEKNRIAVYARNSPMGYLSLPFSKDHGMVQSYIGRAAMVKTDDSSYANNVNQAISSAASFSLATFRKDALRIVVLLTEGGELNHNSHGEMPASFSCERWRRENAFVFVLNYSMSKFSILSPCASAPMGTTKFNYQFYDANQAVAAVEQIVKFTRTTRISK